MTGLLSRFLSILLLSTISISGSFAGTQVIMLGTGSPVPIPDRSGPAVAVVVDEKAYLFDFGFGVMRRAAAMSPRFGGTIDALAPHKMTIAFLTHLHSDHSGGFADFLLTGWTMTRNEPVKVFGPDGIQELVDGTLHAFKDDIKYRIYGREPTNDRGWRVETQVVKEGLVYQDDSIKVHAFPVLHGSWPNAFGYRIETADKVIVYSGDLRPSDKIREYSTNADILIHEVYCESGYKKQSTARLAYHADNHTSGPELGELAAQVSPGLLVLNHVLWFECTADEIIKEVKTAYKGDVVVAEDLDVYE